MAGNSPPPELAALLDDEGRDVGLLVDAGGVITWSDARAERLGLSAGRSLLDVIVPGCEDKARELCRQGAERVVRSWELPLLVDGVPTTALFSARPGAGGVALLASLIAQDYVDATAEGNRAVYEIVALNRELARQKLRLAESNIAVRGLHDELEQQAERLRTADRRKDEFLAMLAHELRNPLAAIQTGLPLLERFEPRDEVEARTREVMRRQTLLLTQLVDDLLDVSRVTRSRIQLALVRLDLTRIVSQVCDGFRTRVIEPRRQRLVCHCPPEPVLVAGDAGRLEQILTNLVDNASKYSDPDTTIEVTLRKVGDRAELAVRDEGIGIDADTLPTIFDLFAQAPTTLDRSRGGLGIGLTLVRALVELHGGQIAAASPGVGKGTTITIQLPIDHAHAAPRAPEPAIAVGTCSVLVVDDNTDGRQMLRDLCEHYGQRVIEAADGEEGIARAVEHEPDIAFVDIGLPTIDGYEVARRVRAHFGGRGPRLVALSGYGAEEHRVAAIEAGFDTHIAKPIALPQLLRELAATKQH